MDKNSELIRNNIKYCPEHQNLAGLSICLKLELACKKAIQAGLCPKGYKVAQPRSTLEE